MSKLTEKARAIIPYNDGIIVIHRIKTNEEYYVFPGGGIEKGESLIECVEREVFEEVGIECRFRKVLFEQIYDGRKVSFAYVKYHSGTIGTGQGPEFNSDEYRGRGKYIPEVKTLDELSKLNLLPQIAEIIKNDLKLYWRN